MSLRFLQAIAFLLTATILEVSADAVVRIALHDHAGVTAVRIGLFVLGAVVLLGYATFLNMAPMEFREVVGLYAKRHVNALVPVSVPNNYYNVGVEWNPIKIVDLSLVYKHEDASHGTFSTQNGTIGGSIDGDYDEVGIFGQLRW